jgi:hypothetical protein
MTPNSSPRPVAGLLGPNQRRPSTLRKLVGWPLTWLLYLIGHGLSRIMIGPLGALYPLYNRVIQASAALNDWAALTVWSKPDAGPAPAPSVADAKRQL